MLLAQGETVESDRAYHSILLWAGGKNMGENAGRRKYETETGFWVDSVVCQTFGGRRLVFLLEIPEDDEQ